MGKKNSTRYTLNTKGLISTAFTMYGFLGDMTILPMKQTVRFFIDEVSAEVSLRETVNGTVVNPRSFEFFLNKTRANNVAQRIARKGNRASGGPSLIMGNAVGYCERAAIEGAPVWKFSLPRLSASEVIDVLIASSDKDYTRYGEVIETKATQIARGELVKDWLTTNAS